MKKFCSLLLILVLCLSLASCGESAAPGDEAQVRTNDIVLTGSSAKASGKGVSVSGNVITISSEGEYHLSGTLDDGQIIIDTGTADAKVLLYMDNADVTCLTAPAIYVLQAKSLHIILPEGTESRLVSGTESMLSSYDGTANGGAIFAEDDVDFEGEGKLNIFGYINNGITCKDDVKIEGGQLSIIAANNGIKGSESVSVSGGSVAVQAGNDGIKATSATKEGKGYVLISGGEVSVNCEADGISAETDLTVSGGAVSVTSTGDPLQGSCKGLKGETGIVISGGDISINTPDHAIRSTAGVSVNGGSISAVSSQAKGIVAHGGIELLDGAISVVALDNGIEATSDMLISGGSLNIVSGNDGLRAGEKSDGTSAATGVITISGGDIIIDAAADPIDAKDSASITGGSFIGTGTPNKAKDFASGSRSFISTSFAGSADSELSIEGEGVSGSAHISRKFSFVLCSLPEMSSGATVKVSAASNSADIVCR